MDGDQRMIHLLRRLGFYVLTAWAAVTVNFFIPHLMPGDPVQNLITRQQGKASPQAVEALRVQLGLTGNQSLWSEYLHYFGQLVHGNLGISTSFYPASVGSVLSAALPWTVALVGVSTVVSFLAGTLVGIVVAWRRGSWLDGVLPVATFFQAVPYFFFALIVLIVLGSDLGLFPISGGADPSLDPGLNGPFIGSVLAHGFLPMITIVISSIAGWILGMRNMMVTTMDEDYVLVAAAKGLPTRQVVGYAARNAILPNVSSFSLSLSFVVSGALLTEIVFSYPGIGYQLLQAVQAEDFPLLQGIFLVITFAVLAANLLADIVYAVLDPRTRQEG
ncbi:MAG TPA: ABC transporter permease [Pseudonocardiaceae bacterium]|jgi:peptide/nickel transport system permease protein|nr:ABC transporter permease [Pseudonocardiaceae bacterium]